MIKKNSKIKSKIILLEENIANKERSAEKKLSVGKKISAEKKTIVTKEIIADNYRLLSDSMSQARGLMFTRKKNDFCLIFDFHTPRTECIHMWFVFYAIDVIILDEKKKIIALKEHLSPFSIYCPGRKMTYLIELPSGTIKKKGISINELINWDEKVFKHI